MHTLRLQDGTKVDSNVGGEPLNFTAGEGRVIPCMPSIEEVTLKGPEGNNVTFKVKDSKKLDVVFAWGDRPYQRSRSLECSNHCRDLCP
jgi:hypothetical protein